MPTLWGFMDFNYSPTSEVGEVHTEPAAKLAAKPATEPATKPALKAATWEYPDDCFYIKMYVLCPLQPLQEAFGPCHGYGDEKRGGVGGP